jgi:alcohol dehydrogenase class IV
VLDLTLLRGLPWAAAAPAGMDALTHAAESQVGVHSSVMTKLLAYEATRRIGASIEAFVDDASIERHATPRRCCAPAAWLVSRSATPAPAARMPWPAPVLCDVDQPLG